MRIVLLSEVFCKDMGYLENLLPKHLARLGVEVHVIATDLPPYSRQKGAKQAYEGFFKRLQPGTVEALDGFTLHIIGHKELFGHMRMVGLQEKLFSIRPHIVQSTVAIGWIALQAALLKPVLGYRLFTGNHHHASVFPLSAKKLSPWSKELLHCRIGRTLPGWIVSLSTEKCYAITTDCADIATRFFGVGADKVFICPLGTDTEVFFPASTEKDHRERSEFRRQLGFSESEIVCTYSGRFSEDKNPLLLARALTHLQSQGLPFRGLFIGNGVQEQAIKSCNGCVTHGFVAIRKLGEFYRASDIGVWPTQESTSMLDAAACGLPIIANHTMCARERLDGNGATYQLNNLDDLVRVLLEFRDPIKREHFGLCGANKMVRQFSWESVARRRLRDYQAALQSEEQPGQEVLSKPGTEKAS